MATSAKKTTTKKTTKKAAPKKTAAKKTATKKVAAKKEYNYTQKFKLIIKIIMYSIIIIIWSRFIKDALTFISVISAAFTIALRDLIFNFFCGIYIKINKPFEVEDRIVINKELAEKYGFKIIVR